MGAHLFALKKNDYTRISLAIAALAIGLNLYAASKTETILEEPVQACVIAREQPMNRSLREQFSACLGWQDLSAIPVCHGYYQSLEIQPLPNSEIQIKADKASLYPSGRSELKGHVEIRESERIVDANMAYIYRDAKSKKVTKIDLLGGIRYQEPGRLMFARSASINPEDKSGRIDDVLYRFNSKRSGAALPAWGRAKSVERFPNKDYSLMRATYTTCRPTDKAWQIEAGSIDIDDSESKGVARNAVLKVQDWPILYTPYISFPTNKDRKSGFLMPMYGYSNVGGFDLGLPYYLNLAPNYDATFVPHIYSERGMMVGGDFRYLNSNSTGILNANILPDDRAFGKFVQNNKGLYPSLRDLSDNRWSVAFRDNSQFAPDLNMAINFQQVSDDYYLQDFSSDLAILTQNQLLRQGDVSYFTEHWYYGAMLQSYQTLHPINQSAVSDIYQRLPQLRAQGIYNELPLNANFNILGQFDYFNWPGEKIILPEGPRYHLNPVLAFPYTKSWGYFTPTIEAVENYYDIQYRYQPGPRSVNRTIPRYELDTGLFFERNGSLFSSRFTETLEPRLFYLNVPYHNQSMVPAYDSGYMIFNVDQLFRNNRFSGFDRIADANQLSYALTSRWLSDETGQEKANFSVGQIRYFADRRVQLCYEKEGLCLDRPDMIGFLSPVAKSSPVASRVNYLLNPFWTVSADYIWNPYTKSTNNADLNFHYQPAVNHILNLGYSYLVSGDVTNLPKAPFINRQAALNQATLSYAWPLTDRLSSIGVYSYNISKQYNMLAFAGVQYDNCCWAVRLFGGQTFKSLDPLTAGPQYNNNVYLQVLLKGLGSAASGDPSTTIQSYLPGYADLFKS